MGVHVSLILKPLPPPSPSHPSVLSAPALSTLSHALNLDWQSVSHMIIFMFVDCFSNFYLNTWWTFLWPHIVSCHFAPLWGPSLSWKYTPIFLLLWPLPALTDSSSSSQTPYVCDLPLLHCSELHASALSSRGGCDDHFSLISPNFEVDNSLPLQVHELLEGTSCVFLWGTWHRLVIMNVCWMNVQTPSDWPKMLEIVTESLLLLERMKWWCTVCPGVRQTPKCALC